VLDSGTEERETFYEARRPNSDHIARWWNDVSAYAIQVPFILGDEAKVPVWNRKSSVSLAKQAAAAYRLVGALENWARAPVVVVPPLRGIGAKMPVSVWAKVFRYAGRMPSEHARDAAAVAVHAIAMIEAHARLWPNSSREKGTTWR